MSSTLDAYGNSEPEELDRILLELELVDGDGECKKEGAKIDCREVRFLTILRPGYREGWERLSGATLLLGPRMGLDRNERRV